MRLISDFAKDGIAGLVVAGTTIKHGLDHRRLLFTAARISKKNRHLEGAGFA
jgi:hypothetical protein